MACHPCHVVAAWKFIPHMQFSCRVSGRRSTSRCVRPDGHFLSAFGSCALHGRSSGSRDFKLTLPAAATALTCLSVACVRDLAWAAANLQQPRLLGVQASLGWRGV
jgi:hypothetical protein